MNEKNELHYSNDVEQVTAAWREQLGAAAENPWLAEYLLKYGERILARFIYFYERLRALPRRTRRYVRRKLALSLSAAALLLALSGMHVPVAHAANIIVGGTCTLADAITAANTDTATGGCAAGDAGLDTLDITNDITLTTALPAITTDITIAGNGHTIQRDGTAGNFRILEVQTGGVLTLNDATITGGNVVGDGGGVFNYNGVVTINDSTISGNTASDEGGGVYNKAKYGTAAITINDSTISDNHATGPHANGGGVANDGYYGYATVTIANSTISGNTASDDGGGVANDAYYYGYATVTIANSTISGNTASDDGGGVANDADDCGTATVNITNSTISGNTASDNGGGVYNDASVSWADYAKAAVNITNSTISGNTASDDGGGVANDAYAYTGYAGATVTVTATVTIANSTISGNDATNGDGGGVANDARAHDFYANATVTATAEVNIANSTISGNTASDKGGGVYNDAFEIDGTATATVDFGHSIVSGNTASAGNEVHDDAVVTANDYNLFGDSSETDAQAFSGSSGFAPTVPTDIKATSDGGGTPTALGDILNTTLADNGGPTETHALVTGSPALDAGDPNFGPLPTHDQRGDGFPRVVNGVIDIGAYEYGAIPVGGVTMPAEGLELLAPATGLLAALVALATSGVALVRRRRR